MQTDVLEHPAVKAWNKLRPDQVEPQIIELLHKKKQTWIELQSGCTEPESIESLDRKKRVSIIFRSEDIEPEMIGQPEIIEILQERKPIYRLKGVGPKGSAVIAKQCEKGDGMLQHTIYEEILSRLPTLTLRYYGLVEEPNSEFCWLFLEDAGSEQFSFHIGEHRALAARWLGLMHTSAAHVAATVRLPDRGPDYYLEHLQSARDTIQRAIVNSTLSPDNLVVLDSIVSQCNAVESCWSNVERFCDRMPQTLVHSDFTSKNIRVRSGQAGIALLPFDWEMAGRGIPAADLAHLEQADLAIYWSVVRRSWPYLDVQDIQQMAILGRILRGLAGISWRSLDFEYSWESWPPEQRRLFKDDSIKWALMSMKVCQVRIANAMRAAKWEN